MATITDDTQFIPAGSKANQQETHREHVFPVQPGRQFTFFRINDEQYGCNNIPFGWVNTHLKGSQPKEENVTTPVIPLRYTEASFDPQQAEPLREGWLYTFRNGKLWREQEITSSSYFKDVHLVENKGKNHRKATSIPDSRVMLPHKINCKIQVIEMAYSEVQWSWNYIKKLEEKADLRTKRMQEIPLDNYNSGFAPNTPTGNQALVENIKNAPPLPRLFLDKQSEIPVVYLHDTLGIAQQYIDAYATVRMELFSLLSSMESLDHLKNYPDLQKLVPDEKLDFLRTTLKSYHTFFNKELWDEETKVSYEEGERETYEVYKNRDSGSGQLRTCAKNLDRDYIEEILAVDKRRELRTTLRAIKNDYTAFLNGQDAEGQPFTGLASDFISVENVIIDHANLNDIAYILFFNRATELFNFLNIDPVIYDNAYSLDSVVRAERIDPEKDSGVQYMNSILQPGNPINAMLFPTSSQVDPYSEEPPVPGQPEPIDGSGAFRPNAFAATYIAADQLKVGQTQSLLVKRVIKQGKKISGDLISIFNKQWLQAIKQKQTIELECIVRYCKATGDPVLKGLKLVRVGESMENLIPLETTITSQGNPLLRKGKDGIRAMAQAGKKMQEYLDIVHSKTNEVMGSQNINRIGQQHKGVRSLFSKLRLKELFGTVKKTNEGYKFIKAKCTMVVVPEGGVFAQLLNNSDYTASTGAKLSASALRAMGKTLPPIVLVLEGMNWGATVVNARNNPDKFKTAGNMVRASIGFAYATLDAPVKVFGKPTVNRFLAGRGTAGKEVARIMTGRTSIKIRGHHLKCIKLVGSAGAGAGMVMSAWDAVDSIRYDDYDTAAGHSIAAVGSGLYCLSLLGEAGIVGLAGFAGPWGWAFIGLTTLGLIIATMCTDTALEKWAKHGPLTRDPEDRMVHDFADKSHHYVLSFLTNELMRPNLTIIKDKSCAYNDPATNELVQDFVVELIAPGFVVDQSILEVHATVEMYERNVHNNSWSGKQHPMAPHGEITAIFSEIIPHLQIGVRYRFKGVASYSTWRVRARHIAPNQVNLPPLPKDVSEAYGPEILEDTPGFLYAETKLGGEFCPPADTYPHGA